MHKLQRILLTLALASGTATMLHAQYQNPTPEELKMTEDPKAPGAAAVYLNLEDILDDTMCTHTIYARIKVLSEKGLDLATVNVPYIKGVMSVTSLHARTIHPDGSISELTGKPDDLMTVKVSDNNDDEVQLNRVVINLPNVTIGSILEYRFIIRYPDNSVSQPDWFIQKEYFIHKAYYSFKPIPNFQPGSTDTSLYGFVDENKDRIRSLIWFPVLPQGAALKQEPGSGKYSLTVTDVPPIPHEDFMPPMGTYQYKVRFYFSGADSAKTFWSHAALRWNDTLEQNMAVTDAVRNFANSNVNSGDSQTVKAQKLYAVVQSFDNTTYSHRKKAAEAAQHVGKPAEEILQRKSGSDLEITRAYIALLRAVGIKVKALKVADRAEALFTPSYMTAKQLTATLLVATLDGKETYLDPGEKFAPFGTVSWRHSNASGFIQGDEKNPFTLTPGQNYLENRITRNAEVDIQPTGSCTAKIRINMTGQDALQWRQTSIRNADNAFRKKLRTMITAMLPQGISVVIDHTDNLNDPSKDFIVYANAKGVLGTTTAKRLMVPGNFFSGRSDLPFIKQETRLTPVDVHYGNRTTDEVTFHVPAALSIEGVPQNHREDWKSHALFVTSATHTNDTIVVKRDLQVAFTFVKAVEYADLRSFYQKVAEGDQQQLVLSNNAPATTGN